MDIDSLLNGEKATVNDKETKAINYLKNKISSEKSIQNRYKKSDSLQEVDYTNIDTIISDSNNYFLLKVLSPQIQENEKKKRIHKEVMLNAIVLFLKVQFILLFVLVFGTLLAVFIFHGLHNDLTDQTFKIIIGFLGVYISSIIVELIYIVKYIVVNVFDTSIDGLVKLFSGTSVEHGNNDINNVDS